MPKSAISQPRVLTIGHSTRPLSEFIALLAAHSVSRLIDVRTVPRSRHNPQFNSDTMPAALVVRGIRVDEIINANRLETHKLTPLARVDGAAITYPPEAVSS